MSETINSNENHTPQASPQHFTDGYLRVERVLPKFEPLNTFDREHHIPPTQVKRNPVVDLDSTSYEAYDLLFKRNKKQKYIADKRANYVTPQQLSP